MATPGRSSRPDSSDSDLKDIMIGIIETWY